MTESSEKHEMMRKMELLNVSKVKEGLATKTLGHPLIWFRELPSTNDMAKELAEVGTREGTVIVAETQTHGKGRLNRQWVSPAGGMWLSVILRPRIQPKHVPKLTLMVCVAVAKTVQKLASVKAEVKWPNDVLVNGKKVCGILTEAKTRGEVLNFVVVGIGINANFGVDDLPVGLRDSATTIRDEVKREIERENLLRTLLVETELYYDLFMQGRFNTILTEWRSSASFLGSYVEVVSQAEKVEGWAVDVDQDGALILRLRDQTMQKVLAGDLTILRTRE